MLPVSEQITFLYTTDLARSAPFYEQALGLPLALDQGGCRLYRVIGGRAYLGLCQRATPRTPDGVIFTFVTPDVDAWYARLVAHGVTCEHAPRVNDTYGIYHFFVRDPNGYLLEVQRFLADPWDSAAEPGPGPAV
ncbi:MAG: VOC family protein [Anaerolineae bacterium]|jgi:catechol 2,3-dioxygenase-like lactoylglutathione lyase family enzyme|nr:VOC family protein [Anaerolineae bacterium]